MCGLTSTRGHDLALVLSHGATLQHDAMTVVYEAIQDGIGQRRFIDIGVPLIDWQLARDQRRFLVVTILEDLQQVAL